MATIKSYTDINQSKKLAKILPLESADMYYCYGMCIYTKKWEYDITPTFIDPSNQPDICDIPCWSLATLLDILPLELFNGDYNLRIDGGIGDCEWILSYDGGCDFKFFVEKDNLVDACYEMVVKLHELKIL